MAGQVHKVNKTTVEVNLQEINPTKLHWVHCIMSIINNDDIVIDIAVKNSLAAKVLALCKKKLTKHSPFIELSQKQIALKLQSSESNTSTAIKFLLNYEPCIFLKVKSGVFAINPTLAWKTSILDRSKWIEYIDHHGIEKAYRVYKAGELVDEFETILNKQ